MLDAFEPWGVKSHTVATVNLNPDSVKVTTTTGGGHEWKRPGVGDSEYYYESKGSPDVDIFDRGSDGGGDAVITDPASPSQPASSLVLEGPGKGDDSFIDVIFNYVDLP